MTLPAAVSVAAAAAAVAVAAAMTPVSAASLEVPRWSVFASRAGRVLRCARWSGSGRLRGRLRARMPFENRRLRLAIGSATVVGCGNSRCISMNSGESIR